MAVAEGEFPTFRRRRFPVGTRSAEWLAVEVDDPVVSRVFERGGRLLPADRFEVVVDDLLGGRKLLLC